MVRHHPKINKKNKRNCAKKCIFYDTLFTVERPLLIETDMIVCLETLQSLTCFFKVMKARARALRACARTLRNVRCFSRLLPMHFANSQLQWPPTDTVVAIHSCTPLPCCRLVTRFLHNFEKL